MEVLGENARRAAVLVGLNAAGVRQLRHAEQDDRRDCSPPLAERHGRRTRLRNKNASSEQEHGIEVTGRGLSSDPGCRLDLPGGEQIVVTIRAAGTAAAKAVSLEPGAMQEGPA
jgi:hypothetical protein